jgi:hypothetical protein
LKTTADIELKSVMEHARLGLDDDDIASILEVSVALMTEVYHVELERARAERRAILLSNVWKSAKEGKTNILIWLGKVELGWAERAKRGKVSPRQKPDEPYDFDSFVAQFNSILVDGKPPDDAILRRLAMTSIRDELESQQKPPPIVDLCIISTPSRASSSKEPSSTTAGSPSTPRRSKPSS